MGAATDATDARTRHHLSPESFESTSSNTAARIGGESSKVCHERHGMAVRLVAFQGTRYHCRKGRDGERFRFECVNRGKRGRVEGRDDGDEGSKDDRKVVACKGPSRTYGLKLTMHATR